MNDALLLTAVRPSRSRNGGTNTSALLMQIDRTAQRDALLPKLVSGEVALKYPEHIVETYPKIKGGR